jgi:hypothetical protein
MGEIKYDDHRAFLKLFEYNYPYKIDTLSFIYFTKDNSDYLKREILTNFISLNLDEKLGYLEQISFDITQLKKNVWATKETLEKWYTKYDVPEDFIFNGNNSFNTLYGFLQSEMPTFRERFEPDYDPDLEASSFDFYNYYYGKALNEMLDYIAEQKNKLQSSTISLFTKVNESKSSNQLKIIDTNIQFLLKLYDNIELGEKSTVMYYNDIWSKFFLDLKNEIQENLIALPKEDRIIYLECLINKISSRLLEFGYNEEDIKKWLNKYNITEDLLWGHKREDNELYHILESWPPCMEKFELPNFNKDTESIQNDFYNYILIRNANETKNFINEQLGKLKSNNQQIMTNNKLKTKLTVPQLALLFKLLDDEKLFDIKTKTELHKFISNNFQTKKQENISESSVKNKMDTPEATALEFWDETLLHLRQQVQKIK